MKALTQLQRESLGEFQRWLNQELKDKRVVYLSEAPLDINHIPLRALKDIVTKYNKESREVYVIGCKHTAQPISEMTVYLKGIFDGE